MIIDASLKRKLRKRRDPSKSKSKNKIAHATIQAIVTRYANGARAVDLAHEFGCSRASVYYHVTKARA